MLQLAYASSAPRPLSSDELVGILRVSRRNNVAAGVTGALLHSEGNFMQILEGPEAAVAETFHRIEGDPRHRGVLILLRQAVEERQFPDWSMGFRSLDGLSDEDRAGAQTLFDLTAAGPTRAARLLHTFRYLPADLRFESRLAAGGGREGSSSIRPYVV